MLEAHTVERIRAVEAELMAGLPAGALMQRAATGLGYAILGLLRDLDPPSTGRTSGAYGRRVLLLVGSGDNGGDALYAGALLAGRGAAVVAWLLTEAAHPGGVEALRGAGGRVSRWAPGTTEPFGPGRPPEVVVDGIVGIGGRPGLRPEAEEALAAVAGVPVVAVDVPSGLDVDAGEAPAPHVTADLTVTFGTHRVAHLADPAALACGDLHLVDLGFGAAGSVTGSAGDAGVTALEADDVARLLPRPEPRAHKYTRGVVGILAGSRTYAGAASLCVAGANTGLVGMVRYTAPDGDQDAERQIRSAHPEVVGEGRVQAYVVGPGTHTAAAEALARAVGAGVPLVVDADALAQVSGPLGVPAVLTPHAGELAGMLGVPRAEIEAAPLAFARAAAARWEATVLLKGRRTLIVRPDGATRVTIIGTPWLGTAGAGDVLSGLIGALLAAGCEPFDAAGVGSWLHAAAATLAGDGGPIRAGEIAAAVPEVVRRMLAPAG
ncbi:bifunctional ADP-dependent NAD(P)H-hydrate dehydratase/NAD(P)H-hydrate epimerase [Nocardioides insulae]|uniref:bifunctional ADP-dependent NAD(P)H-hydrate dehydratase/NAD(P)H-hydrate epimerase n=1 Tax=Nocardioides insulae TaxID=394734 RepID=UPI0003FB1792|nr:bifunctional ADP-dependent NAD(P)H-hydrate dehydratase/NAD(P)H-hydrate epimerase [Nocardioides insulae]